MRKETREDFVKVIAESESMAEAARKMGMSYDTFKRKAQHYGVFNPNQAGKGRKKPKVFKTREDVFKIFDYNVGREAIKNWYLLENTYECERCGISKWNGEHLTLELEHINGNRRDNRIENLKLLCPNCHSQTETWRKRNKPVTNQDVEVTDDELKEALREAISIRQALLKVGLVVKGSNYNRAKKLVEEMYIKS